MKLSKKTATLLSIAIGATIFTTTALAEVITKSGYDQFKDSVKLTTSSLSNKFSSSTVEMSSILKDNDKVISTSETVNRYDNANKISDFTSTTTDSNNKISKYYSYNNAKDKVSINYNSEDKVYRVVEGESFFSTFSDPFSEKRMEDLEKVGDAIVGNLKDSVVTTNTDDGSKLISGNLSESQIPALVNALVSYYYKNTISQMHTELKAVQKDIYIKDVQGKEVIDNSGIIRSVVATAEVSGVDKLGKVHILTIDIMLKISDINSTKIEAPDLTGKKVDKQVVSASPTKEGNFVKNYVGKFKNDIILITDDGFKKIGERTLIIDKINNKTASGSYEEVYINEYKDSDKKIEFTAENTEENNKAIDYINFNITVKGESNVSGNLNMNCQSSGVSFYYHYNPNGNIIWNGYELTRAFD